MAFGKKGKGEAETPVATAEDAAPDEAELSESMFGGDEPAVDAVDAVAAGDDAATPTASAPAEADPVAGGDLLNMFQTTQIELEDLSVILDLAGDIDLDDLLEDLHTVAAALGCDVREEQQAA